MYVIEIHVFYFQNISDSEHVVTGPAARWRAVAAGLGLKLRNEEMK